MLETVKIVLMWVAVVGVAFLIWLVAEGALTVRKVRKVVDELKERIEPTLAHVEQITSSLEPAIARIDPLMERVSLTVDSVNVELMQLDKILDDASHMTGAASNAVQKVSDITNAPTKLANNAANKLRDTFSKRKGEKRTAAAVKAASEAQLQEATGANADSAKLAGEWAAQANGFADVPAPDDGDSMDPASTGRWVKVEIGAVDTAEAAAEAEAQADAAEATVDDALADVEAAAKEQAAAIDDMVPSVDEQAAQE